MLGIKQEYINRKVVFGNFNNSLAIAKQSDLRKLAILALKSQDATLLELFEGELPDLFELQDEQLNEQEIT